MRPVWSTALRRTLMGSMGAVLHPQRSARPFGFLPKLPERGGDPVGLRLMRRVEVMESLEDFSREVREQSGQPRLHGRPAGMRSRPATEVDRGRESGVLVRLDAVLAERDDVRTNSG